MLRPFLASLAAVAMALSAGGARAQVLFQSTFDSTTEGWTGVATAGAGSPIVSVPVSFMSSAGGGSLFHSGPLADGRTSFYLAPSGLVSALHSAIGGSVSFDVGSTPAHGDVFYATFPDILIRAGSNEIRMHIFSVAPSPSFDHVNLSFTTASPWIFFDGTTRSTATQANIDGVLAGAALMVIRAEYWASANADSALLDNVLIAGPIPEPETYAMLLAGLALLGFAARRRKPKEDAAA